MGATGLPAPKTRVARGWLHYFTRPPPCQRRSPDAATPRDAHETESLAVFYTSQADGREGVKAFNEKRTAQFTGKASQMPPFFPWYENK